MAASQHSADDDRVYGRLPQRAPIPAVHRSAAQSQRAGAGNGWSAKRPHARLAAQRRTHWRNPEHRELFLSGLHRSAGETDGLRRDQLWLLSIDLHSGESSAGTAGRPRADIWCALASPKGDVAAGMGIWNEYGRGASWGGYRSTRQGSL